MELPCDCDTGAQGGGRSGGAGSEMLKQFGYFSAVLLILAVGLPLFMRAPDGRPLLTFTELLQSPLRVAEGLFGGAADTVRSAGIDVINGSVVVDTAGRKRLRCKSDIHKY